MGSDTGREQVSSTRSSSACFFTTSLTCYTAIAIALVLIGRVKTKIGLESRARVTLVTHTPRFYLARVRSPAHTHSRTHTRTRARVSAFSHHFAIHFWTLGPFRECLVSFYVVRAVALALVRALTLSRALALILVCAVNLACARSRRSKIASFLFSPILRLFTLALN